MDLLVLLAVESAQDGAITLPWAAWAVIGTALVSVVAWLAKSWRASADQLLTLTREVSIAMTANTEVLRECTTLLREVAQLVRGKRNDA